MHADLHTHTTASDGTLTPSALVSRAALRGVSVLAVTDHDSVSGVDEARTAADREGVTLITGVELSAVEDGVDVHILGYFIDHSDPELLAHLKDLREARLSRASSIVSALREAGFAIELDDVLALSDGGAIGRSHVARVLVSGGHTSSVSEAFERLLGRGKPFYVAKDVRDAKSVIRIIRAAGGLPVLAHPAITGIVHLIEPLMHEGLVGVEVFHPEHSEDQCRELEAIAQSLSLLVTGGTDFHSPDAPSLDVGAIQYPAEHARAFLAAGE